MDDNYYTATSVLATTTAAFRAGHFQPGTITISFNKRHAPKTRWGARAKGEDIEWPTLGEIRKDWFEEAWTTPYTALRSRSPREG